VRSTHRRARHGRGGGADGAAGRFAPDRGLFPLGNATADLRDDPVKRHGEATLRERRARPSHKRAGVDRWDHRSGPRSCPPSTEMPMRRTLLAVASLLASTAAIAGTSTSNLTVTATVTDSCSVSAGTLAFGTYDTVTGTAVDGTGTVTVACTSGASSTVTLGQGSYAAGGSSDAVPLRQMGSGSDRLAYTLYQDAGRTTVWGNTGGTGVAYTATSSATSDLTVYGTVDAGQDVPAGSYSDTVVATITF
jgi:spore coat protein U-like protein